MQDTWDDSEPLREAIGEKSSELWDDSAPLREDLEEKFKDGWNIAEEWSTQKYDELKQSKENPDNSSSWLNFSDSVKKMRTIQQQEVHSKNYEIRRSPVQNNQVRKSKKTLRVSYEQNSSWVWWFLMIPVFVNRQQVSLQANGEWQSSVEAKQAAQTELSFRIANNVQSRINSYQELRKKPPPRL